MTIIKNGCDGGKARELHESAVLDGVTRLAGLKVADSRQSHHLLLRGSVFLANFFGFSSHDDKTSNRGPKSSLLLTRGEQLGEFTLCILLHCGIQRFQVAEKLLDVHG